MTRHRKFSNCRTMVLASTLALLCNAKAFPVDVTSGDWPEVNHDKLETRYSSLALINTSNAKKLKMVYEYKFSDKEPSQSAYNPRLETIFVPAVDWCATFKKDASPPDAEKEHTHGFYFGGKMNFDKWNQAREFQGSTARPRYANSILRSELV